MHGIQLTLKNIVHSKFKFLFAKFSTLSVINDDVCTKTKVYKLQSYYKRERSTVWKAKKKKIFRKEWHQLRWLRVVNWVDNMCVWYMCRHSKQCERSSRQRRKDFQRQEREPRECLQCYAEKCAIVSPKQTTTKKVVDLYSLPISMVQIL